MPDPIPLVVHATHEAGIKLGGIGAVLDGLLGCGEYVQNVQRTVLTGPMLAGDQTHMERFFEPRNGVTVSLQQPAWHLQRTRRNAGSAPIGGTDIFHRLAVWRAEIRRV